DAMHHLDRMDQTNEQGGNYYPWPTTRNLCWILWEDHLAKPQFDSIRSDEKFLACFALLKANAGALQ
ncbi:MAG: hypothetical protein LBS96_04730, partial [Oscillospiraceae bacterium]|nr:hypothetical protein [Oscillospiraceae bacterium]